MGPVGANGAGTTTLMRMLLDFIRPTSRSLTVFGHDSVRDSVEVRRLATYLPLLLVVFVPIWYLVMYAMAGHAPLTFKLFSTGRLLRVDGGDLTLITAGLNALTIIVGFAVFDAVRVLVKSDLKGLSHHHGRPDGHLPAEPARQPTRQQTAPAVVPVLRPDAVRSRRLVRTHRAVGHLAIGLLWAVGLAGCGLVIFRNAPAVAAISPAETLRQPT